jgi:hypothetical protein
MTMAVADATVTNMLREDILNPAAIALAIETVIERYAARPGNIEEQRVSVEGELRQLDAEIGRLVEALASGQPLASVQDAIRTRERRRDDLRAKVEHLDGLSRTLDSTRARLLSR